MHKPFSTISEELVKDSIRLAHPQMAEVTIDAIKEKWEIAMDNVLRVKTAHLARLAIRYGAESIKSYKSVNEIIEVILTMHEEFEESEQP